MKRRSQEEEMKQNNMFSLSVNFHRIENTDKKRINSRVTSVTLRLEVFKHVDVAAPSDGIFTLSS